jgi:hypothetical protein
MRAAVGVLLSLATLPTIACRYDLDHAEYADAAQARLCKPSTSTQSCLDADAHSDFTFIYTSTIKPKCVFSGCHDGSTAQTSMKGAGRLDYKKDQATAHASLVADASLLDPTRTIVVAGNAHQSFLMVMMGAIKPMEADPPLDAIPKDDKGNNVGTMPQGSPVICCQKLDAIERWITAGAAND